MHEPIVAHFKNVDRKIYNLSQQFDPSLWAKVSDSHNYFENLCHSIANQQLSVKAAATIWQRLITLLNEQPFTPEVLVSHSVESLRSIGLSRPKAGYILGISQAALDGKIDFESLDQYSNGDIIKKLTELKGVGVWTAEMFLMFTLNRSDIFSTGDLGLKRAIEKLYDQKDPSIEKLLEISLPWAPYRTYASRLLWLSLDNTPS